MNSIVGHELVGQRRKDLVGQLPAPDQVRVWLAVSSRIVKYGFVLEYRDLEPPRTGIFDGLRIVIDPDVGFEMQCFILLHLFGHSVQWVAPSLVDSIGELQSTTDRERFMQVLHDYEYEAARFGLALLHEAGVRDLDAWYSDFVATDWCYVERFYRTDTLPAWEQCICQADHLIEACPIPPLTHRQVEVRFAF
jgi:hypothetical protein